MKRRLLLSLIPGYALIHLLGCPNQNMDVNNPLSISKELNRCMALKTVGKNTGRNTQVVNAPRNTSRDIFHRISSKQMEKELSKRIDKSPCRLKNLSLWIVKNGDLSGIWTISSWHNRVSMSIHRIKGSCYNVMYSAAGDLDSWSLKRRAVFKNGMLLFKRPVQEYGPTSAYWKMYLLRIGGKLWLAGQPVASECLLVEKKRRCSSYSIERMFFSRRSGGNP